MWPSEFSYLLKTVSTQIYDRIRYINYILGLPTSESSSGTILSAYLVILLVYIDGNGYRTSGRSIFSYKI